MAENLNDQTGPANLDDDAAYAAPAPIADHDDFAQPDPPHYGSVPSFVTAELKQSADRW